MRATAWRNGANFSRAMRDAGGRQGRSQRAREQAGAPREAGTQVPLDAAAGFRLDKSRLDATEMD